MPEKTNKEFVQQSVIEEEEENVPNQIFETELNDNNLAQSDNSTIDVKWEEFERGLQEKNPQH